MPEQSSQIHQFGDITVDAVSMRVLRGSEPVALEPKSLKVLLYLIENRDRLVTKEELFKAVWQDTFVTDNALTRTVAQIRKALGDDARQGRIIETVPRLGYRFTGAASPETAPITVKSGDETVMAPVQSAVSTRWLYGIAFLAVLAAAVWAIRESHRPRIVITMNPPFRFESSQFTTSNGLDLYPSFAPDGGSLAYSSDESGSFEIYVRPLTRGARPVQVTSDGRQNLQPAWSPDGRYIAYHSVRDDGIWLVPALGGSRRKLADFGNLPAWSVDGKRLAFHDRALSSLSAVDQTCGARVSGIWVVSAEGGPPSRVPLPDEPNLCQNTDPSWTRDGRITFARQFRGFTQVSLVAPDGSGLRTIEKLMGVAITPRWVPEQSSIFFSNFSPGGDFTIQRLPVDAQGRRAGPLQEVVGHGLGVPRSLAISADGKRLAYTASLPSSRIESLPLKGTGLTPAGPPSPLTSENIYRYTLPIVSPDGKHLAYTLWRKGSNGDIWFSDLDGRNARLLNSAPNNSFCSGWLPDSSAVVYVKYSPGGGQLWSTAVRDGTERRLSSTMLEAAFPTLSPDGRFFVYHLRSDSGGQKLRRVEVATEQSIDLVDEKGMSAGFGNWSRDGKQIAFEIHLGEDVQLATVPSNGGPYTKWTTGHGKTWPGSWTPDGKTIIAAGQRDGVWNVYAIGSDHSERRLTSYTSLREYVRYTRLTPSGDRIVYEYQETKGNIFLGDLGRQASAEDPNRPNQDCHASFIACFWCN